MERDPHNVLHVSREVAEAEGLTPDWECIEHAAYEAAMAGQTSRSAVPAIAAVITAWLKNHRIEFTPKPPERGSPDWFAAESARALAMFDSVSMSGPEIGNSVAAVLQDINDAAERAAGR